MDIVGPELKDILKKVENGNRLSFDDGVRLYQSKDILSLGYMANIIRERKNGELAYFITNGHINYTNICANRCRFCAFSRSDGEPGAYTLTLEEILEKGKTFLKKNITEFHIVGGLHPELPFNYYIEMLSSLKKESPQVHIQAFTAVEISHLAKIAGLSIKDTLTKLKEAGLGSIPGGGAEVFSQRVREYLCKDKTGKEEWLEVMRIAHELGINSNATMLYGHIETIEERVDHLIALRKMQDRTGGFLSFIPLAFHPKNTELDSLPDTTGLEDLKAIAVSRLMLDNFPHIKAFWIMIGTKLAQVSLSFGSDDLDGTVIEEKITHSAGASTEEYISKSDLIRLIKEAGREPVERDTVYNKVQSSKFKVKNEKLKMKN